MIIRYGLVIYFAIIILGECVAQDVVVIQNVNVIPLHISDVYRGVDVRLEGNRIISISQHQATQEPEEFIKTINGEGKYLLPAYVDAHGHLPDSSSLGQYAALQILNGVTRVRSMRGENWHSRLKEKSLPWYYPRFDLGTPPISRRDSFSRTKLFSLVEDWKKRGFDFIKILSLSGTGIYPHLLEASDKYSLPLAGHYPALISFEEFLSTNEYLSIEHLSGILRIRDAKLLERIIASLAKRGTAHCPTLDWYFANQLRLEDMQRKKGVAYVSDERKSVWNEKMTRSTSDLNENELQEELETAKKQFEVRLSYLRFLYRQGGLLLLSPDASGIYGLPGFDYVNEAIHFESAGISNLEILRATSYNYAKMLKQEDVWGSIKVGGQGDLLLLNDNPLDDIRNIQSIFGIFKDGNYYPYELVFSTLEEQGLY